MYDRYAAAQGWKFEVGGCCWVGGWLGADGWDGLLGRWLAGWLAAAAWKACGRGGEGPAAAAIWHGPAAAPFVAAFLDRPSVTLPNLHFGSW
jgi:hypothetical protein